MIGLANDRQQDLAYFKTKLAHLRFVNYYVVADAVHSVVDFHVDWAIFQLDAQRVVEEHHITMPAGETRADHITSSANVGSTAVGCECPDTFLLFAVVKNKVLIQRPHAT